MSIKNFLGIVLLYFASTLYAEDRPNIVFFFADDQTSSALACYGNKIAQTPNIDKLAAEGVRFNNAFVSQPICWVSRTTILTGLTGRSFVSLENSRQVLPEAVETLYSDILSANSYRTGFIGKWHALMPKGWKREAHFDHFEAISRNPFYKKMPDGSLRHETDLIVDRAIDFISQKNDQPFALNLWFNACHAEDTDRRPGIGHFPWPRSLDGMYEDVVFDTPQFSDPAVFANHPRFFKTAIARERYYWRWNTELKYQTNMRAYYRMVTGIDQAIGRFMQALEEKGLADNTIIVYSADNGFYLGNRGFAGKWSHYEESLRVPLIIMDPRLPKQQKGKVLDSIALNLDLPATFLDWAGLELPQHYQGYSLQELVNTGKSRNWRTQSFHEFFSGRTKNPSFEGIRSADYKYVSYFDHDNYEFLHNLKSDPNELVNLANNPEYKEILAQMRRASAERVQQLGGHLEPLKEAVVDSTSPFPKAAAYVSHPADEQGFVSLTNHKKMRNWAGDSKYWKFKNGIITGQHDGSLKQNTFLTWKGNTIQNFELQLKVKITAGGNSGIQYRSQSRPDLGLYSVSGYQCDIVPDNIDYNGMFYEEKGRRILVRAGHQAIVEKDSKVQLKAKLEKKKFPAGQWHEYRIVVKGHHHQHWINGQLIVDVLDHDTQARAQEGVLALQLHAKAKMTVQFKDIRIKHFDD